MYDNEWVFSLVISAELIECHLFWNLCKWSCLASGPDDWLNVPPLLLGWKKTIAKQMMSVENGSLTCEKPRNLTVLLKLKIVQLYFFSFLRGGRIYQIYTFHSEIISQKSVILIWKIIKISQNSKIWKYPAVINIFLHTFCFKTTHYEQRPQVDMIPSSSIERLVVCVYW